MEKTFTKQSIIILTVMLLAIGSGLPWLFYPATVAWPATVIGLHFILLSIACYLFVRFRYLTYLVFTVLPIASLFFFISRSPDWFILAKFYTIVVYLLVIQVTKDFKKLDNKWMYYAIFALLFINIFEATFRDFQNGFYINMVSGILLMVTIPSMKSMRVVKGKTTNFLWDMPILWMLFYAFWNVSFVYSGYPHAGFIQIAVNMIPLLVGLVNPGLWLETRVITLAAHMVTYVYVKPYNMMMYLPIKAEMMGFVVSLSTLHGITLGLGIATLVYTIYRNNLKGIVAA